MTELVAGFPNHYFSSLNDQNCDQDIILKATRTPFPSKKPISDQDGGLPVTFGPRNKNEGGFIFKSPGSWIFFSRPEDQGKASIQILVPFDFFLVALDTVKKRKFGAKSG